MTTTKTKRIKATGLPNRLEFEIAVDRCSFIQTELATLYADRARQVQLAQLYAAEIIIELESEQKAKIALCEKYATDHRPELLDGLRKSAETPLSRWGFRTGTPSLKTLKKASWDKIVENLQKLKLTQFLRPTFEVDKQKLITSQTDAPLAEIGVRVAQEETFFIEPKADNTATVKTEAS